MDQGKQAGEGKGGHQGGSPEGDAQQGCELDVPAANPAVCGKGDGKQEQEAGQESQGAVQHGFREGGPWAGICCNRQGEEAPGKEGKQGGIAYPVVPVVIKCEPGKGQHGQGMVEEQRLTHAWYTSRRTGCPGSARSHSH